MQLQYRWVGVDFEIRRMLGVGGFSLKEDMSQMGERFTSVLTLLNEHSVLVNNYISIMIYMSVKLTLDMSEISQLGREGMVGQGMLEQLWSWGGLLDVSLLKFKFVWLLNSAPKCALTLVVSAICLNLCDSFLSTPLFSIIFKKLMSACLKVSCTKFLLI